MRKIAIVAALLLLFANIASAQEKLVFAALENSPLAVMVDEILKKSYAKINIEAESRGLPGLRALEMADAGEVDGAQLRVATIMAKYKNLIMVPVPVYVVDVVVFTKRDDIKVTGWESIKPYKIGAPSGYTAVLDHLDGFNAFVGTYEQIFSMLDLGRVDMVVLDKFNGINTLKRLNIKGISYLSPPLKSIKFYSFLHKKHDAVVSKITTIMEEMQKNGEIKGIWDRFEERVFDYKDVTKK